MFPVESYVGFSVCDDDWRGWLPGDSEELIQCFCVSGDFNVVKREGIVGEQAFEHF